jgi:hypothetical protein
VILKRKGITPSNTLLHGAYDAKISTLKADRGAAFDRDCLKGQAEYQKGNAALFEQESQNGSDPDLDRSPPFSNPTHCLSSSNRRFRWIGAGRRNQDAARYPFPMNLME